MSESSSISVLFLRLEGPLQSWGDEARWSVRRTRGEPTKSGVIGIIGAALGLGWNEEDDREIERLGRQLRLGVREDRAGTLVRDYHTVVGGVLSAEGKIKINAATREPETVVSERYYLSDACFLVALAGPAELLVSIRGALQDPVWPPYLGRKSCPASLPLWPAVPGHPSGGEYPSLAAALSIESVPWLQDREDRPSASQPAASLRAVVECDVREAQAGVEGVVYPRYDVPLSFTRRQFGVRYVREYVIQRGGAV
jgi:CRISPR-associated protein Cas5/CasD subtype I-E